MAYFRERLHSFKFAFRGISVLFQREPNAWIHLIAAAGAITLGIIYNVSQGEWALIVLCIALVFALELLNSSIEVLCDALHPQRSPGIKRTKDLAAGAVLIGAMGALATACFIFLPKIF